MSQEPLKLRAEDAEDLQIIAAVLQDSIAPMCDMLYDPASQGFVMVVHRFRWDDEATPADTPDVVPVYERVHCAVEITGVLSVFRQDFPLDPPESQACGGMLDLLTLTLDGDSLTFIFAGGAQLQLKLSRWGLQICDYGEPWPSFCQPKHED